MTDNTAALDALKKKISDVCCAAREGSPEQRYAQDALAILEGLMPSLTTPRAPVLPEDLREAVKIIRKLDIEYADNTQHEAIETLIRAATTTQPTDAQKRAYELLDRIDVHCRAVGHPVGGIDELKAIITAIQSTAATQPTLRFVIAMRDTQPPPISEDYSVAAAVFNYIRDKQARGYFTHPAIVKLMGMAQPRGKTDD